MTTSTLLMITAAFQLGMFGSMHCVAMCGGFVCAICHSSRQCNTVRLNKTVLQVSYHIGRLVTYSGLGGLASMLGLYVVNYAGSNGIFLLRLLSSLFVIASGLFVARLFNATYLLEVISGLVWAPIKRISSSIFPVSSYKRALLVGGVWGFIPCGLIYSALMTAASSGSILSGILVMFSFGLGTLPALLCAGLAMNTYYAFFTSKKVAHISGGLLVLFGVISFVLVVNMLMTNTAGQMICH